MTGRRPSDKRMHMTGSFDECEEPDEPQRIYIKDLECGSLSIIFSVMQNGYDLFKTKSEGSNTMISLLGSIGLTVTNFDEAPF